MFVLDLGTDAVTIHGVIFTGRPQHVSFFSENAIDYSLPVCRGAGDRVSGQEPDAGCRGDRTQAFGGSNPGSF